METRCTSCFVPHLWNILKTIFYQHIEIGLVCIDKSFIILYNPRLHPRWPFCTKCSRSPVTSCCQKCVWERVFFQSFLWPSKHPTLLTTPPLRCSWFPDATHTWFSSCLWAFFWALLYGVLVALCLDPSSPLPNLIRPTALNTTYLQMTQFFFPVPGPPINLQTWYLNWAIYVQLNDNNS